MIQTVSALSKYISYILTVSVKYVALLAFDKIVLTHPFLVAQQEDVIMDCIDSPDISIRLRALDLVVGMVSSDNLMSIVGRLMRQLRNSPSKPAAAVNHQHSGTIEPAADSDEESPEVAIKSPSGPFQDPFLPDDYKIDVINRILQMCSSNNYGNLVDFDWYLDILIQLVRSAPVPIQTSRDLDNEFESKLSVESDVSERVGDELRNVAVKVKAVRSQAAKAAESMLMLAFNDNSTQFTSSSGALRPISWVVGEYASHLSSPEDTLTALLQITRSASSAEGLIIYLQALPKLFALLAGDEHIRWTLERKTMISLLMARIIHTLEPLAMHPDLEVQERAVEFSELLKLAAEAASGQDTSSETNEHEAPLLLTQAIPSLFTGQELNSVAIGAQKNVPIPSTLDLEQPINPNLNNLLRAVDSSSFDQPDPDEFEVYYHQQPPPTSAAGTSEPAINRLGGADEPVHSYQQNSEESYLDPDIVARRRAERLERNKDDPFYIAPSDGSGISTPLHSILQSNNGQDLDLDAIPIMQLDLGKANLHTTEHKKPSVIKARQRIQVAADETLPISGSSTPRNDDTENSADGRLQKPRTAKAKHSLLQVDSSHIGAFSLEGDSTSSIDFERQQKEEAEMAKAMREVEKLRLEMQRANERIEAAQGVPSGGTLVKKKKKKVVKAGEGDSGAVGKNKKAKKATIEKEQGGVSPLAVETIKPKKKKKKPKIEEEILEHTEA